MPQVRVIFYQEDNGTTPVLDWLDGLPAKVQAKCRIRIEFSISSMELPSLYWGMDWLKSVPFQQRTSI